MTAHETDWRKRVIADLPALAARVFALRDKMYPGCGFHWSMERALGGVIAILNDYDVALTAELLIITEIKVEELYRDVKEAEANVR